MSSRLVSVLSFPSNSGERLLGIFEPTELLIRNKVQLLKGRNIRRKWDEMGWDGKSQHQPLHMEVHLVSLSYVQLGTLRCSQKSEGFEVVPDGCRRR